MIISASRRTDIPAFYAKWFFNRIRAGYCTVPNPFNRAQVSKISLMPEDVDVIVFWTRNPRPLLPFLPELDARGYRYYFQYTILDSPRILETHTPSLAAALETFRALARHVGSQRVIWRYDPIVLSPKTGASYHLDRYTTIAEQLRGATQRSVISVMDQYKKIEKRMRAVAEQGILVETANIAQRPGFGDLMRSLAKQALANDMEIVSCAEEVDLRPYGIRPGKCVDDDYIRQVFGIEVGARKDQTQRDACGCVTSRDIGMYDSCLFGCQYCYATSSFERSRVNHARHDPVGTSLITFD